MATIGVDATLAKDAREGDILEVPYAGVRHVVMVYQPYRGFVTILFDDGFERKYPVDQVFDAERLVTI